jgi:hypothetical protein
VQAKDLQSFCQQKRRFQAMKKHLLGLAIFSFIVVSFAVAFVFFTTKPEVCHFGITKKPVIENDRRYKCNKKSEIIKFEVLSTQFNSEEGKLISQFRVNFDKNVELPKVISIGTNLYNYKNSEVEKVQLKDELFESFEVNHFKNEATFFVESDLKNLMSINSGNNLCVVFDFYVNHNKGDALPLSKISSEAKPVLFVHRTKSSSKN